jgi:hypothetical protein
MAVIDLMIFVQVFLIVMNNSQNRLNASKGIYIFRAKQKQMEAKAC